MRKSLLLLSFFFISFSLLAVPARMGECVYVQGDGSTITLTKQGDEFFHFYTTADDQVVLRGEEDPENFYFAEIASDGGIKPSNVPASNEGHRTPEQAKYVGSVDKGKMRAALATSMATARSNRHHPDSQNAMANGPRLAADNSSVGVGFMPSASFPSTGSPKVVVILAQFPDMKFTMDDPATYFSNLLNQKGFSEYGATGSAADYFSAASNGQFSPQFDVYGPVTVSKSYSYYGAPTSSGGNDSYPHIMVVHAMNELDATVDFSQYDTDGDGNIDNVYVFYAGYGENYGGVDENCIWPHSWYVKSGGSVYKKYDGVYVDRYACSNEYMYGYNKPEGIGTFVHEFGHVVGLPDLYDTVYGEASNLTPGIYDVMDTGSYNNDGRTPPTYSIFERNAASWAEIEEITADDASSLTLEPIVTSNKGYMIRTGASNEFFLLENRQHTSWDQYIPGHGMLIWHVDYNSSIWASNKPNNTAAHQHVDIEEANGSVNNTSYNTLQGYTFPGTSGNRSFTSTTSPSLTSWDGSSLGVSITNINENGQTVSFDVNGGAPLVVNTPAANVEADVTNCNNAFNLVLTKDNADDTVYYILDYADGVHQDQTVYGEPILLDKPVSVTFWAERSNAFSDKRTVSFTFSVLKPAISPEGGQFTEKPLVTMTTGTEDAEIRYTLDGSEPTEASALYTAPFKPDQKGEYTVKAKAFRAGWTASEVASATYTYVTIVVDNPSDVVFVKVNSADELADGDQIIIVCESTGKAMSKDESSIIGLNLYRKAEDVSYTNGALGNQVVLSENSSVQVLNVVEEANGYRFFDESRNAYLCATSKNGNYIGTQTTLDDNSLAAVSISGGNATIKFQGSNSRNMVQYDTRLFGASFSCYNTTKTSVQLYKRYYKQAESSEELKNLEDGAEFKLESTLQVTFVCNEYVYTFDMDYATFILIIQQNSGLLPGDILENSWHGKVTIVDGQCQLIPDAPLVKVGSSEQDIPEPVAVTAENLFETLTAAADAQPVRLYNVNVEASSSADEPVTATLQPNVAKAPAINGLSRASQQAPQVVLRDKFGTALASDTPLSYDYIDGMANIVGNTIEVYPTTLGDAHNIATEIETISTDTAAPAQATYYDLSGRRVANPANGVFIQVHGNTRKVVRK